MTQANVLLVDDRPENLLALRAILESVGCRLVDAHSGMEALKYLLKDEFALILMDVQMPGLDGFETTTLIKERERTRHIPIIFVTAISKEQNYIFQGYSAGAVDYISKPFDPVILRSKVMVFIDLWAKTEQIKEQAELLRRNEQMESEREMARLELELKRSHLAEIAASQADLERFKATLDATLDGVAIFDATHLRYSYVNQGSLNQLGYEREEMLTMSALEVKTEFDEKKFRRLLKPLLAGQKQSLIYETLHRRKDGEMFPVEVFVQYVSPPFNAPPEELGGFISISRDITERRRAQQLLISAKETAETERTNAERANRAKSEFIAGISHELRTPLNAIIGFSKLLLNPRVGPLNEDQTAYTHDVVQSAEHLLELINDILDLSKIEAGKMALELSSFPFAHLIEQSLTIVRQKAMEKGVDLSVKLPHDENIPTEIIGDARKIKQVMYNLLSNAVKFTPSGGSILVSARYVEKTTDSSAKTVPFVMISVKDSGIGIAEEDQTRIFQAFEQVDSSYARQEQGTGLGLALTQRIVKLHGGQMELESTVGQGSTFSFSLPLEPETEPAAPQIQAPAPRAAKKPAPRKTSRAGQNKAKELV